MDIERSLAIRNWRPKDRAELAQWCREASQHIADEVAKGGGEGFAEALFHTTQASGHVTRFGNVPLARRVRPPYPLPVFTPDQAMALLGECERWAEEGEPQSRPAFTRKKDGFSDSDLFDLRRAVQKLGKAAKPEAVIDEIGISPQPARKGLRYLEKHEGYLGFADRTVRRH